MWRPSDAAQRRRRRQPRGARRRVEAGQGAQDQRQRDAAADRDHGHDQRPALRGGVAAGRRCAERDPRRSRRAARAAPTRRGTARRCGPRARPSARRRPISERRSSTEMTITLAMPTPPTSSATAPRPRNTAVSVLWASARACSASEGRLTCVCSGFCGSAVAPSSESASRHPFGVRADVQRAWRARSCRTGDGRSGSRSARRVRFRVRAAAGR